MPQVGHSQKQKSKRFYKFIRGPVLPLSLASGVVLLFLAFFGSALAANPNSQSLLEKELSTISDNSSLSQNSAVSLLRRINLNGHFGKTVRVPIPSDNPAGVPGGDVDYLYLTPPHILMDYFTGKLYASKMDTNYFASGKSISQEKADYMRNGIYRKLNSALANTNLLRTELKKILFLNNKNFSLTPESDEGYENAILQQLLTSNDPLVQQLLSLLMMDLVYDQALAGGVNLGKFACVNQNGKWINEQCPDNSFGNSDTDQIGRILSKLAKGLLSGGGLAYESGGDSAVTVETAARTRAEEAIFPYSAYSPLGFQVPTGMGGETFLAGFREVTTIREGFSMPNFPSSPTPLPVTGSFVNWASDTPMSFPPPTPTGQAISAANLAQYSAEDAQYVADFARINGVVDMGSSNMGGINGVIGAAEEGAKGAAGAAAEASKYAAEAGTGEATRAAEAAAKSAELAEKSATEVKEMANLTRTSFGSINGDGQIQWAERQAYLNSSGGGDPGLVPKVGGNPALESNPALTTEQYSAATSDFGMDGIMGSGDTVGDLAPPDSFFEPPEAEGGTVNKTDEEGGRGGNGAKGQSP